MNDIISILVGNSLIVGLIVLAVILDIRLLSKSRSINFNIQTYLFISIILFFIFVIIINTIVYGGFVLQDNKFDTKMTSNEYLFAGAMAIVVAYIGFEINIWKIKAK